MIGLPFGNWDGGIGAAADDTEKVAAISDIILVRGGEN